MSIPDPTIPPVPPVPLERLPKFGKTLTCRLYYKVKDGYHATGKLMWLQVNGNEIAPLTLVFKGEQYLDRSVDVELMPGENTIVVSALSTNQDAAVYQCQFECLKPGTGRVWLDDFRVGDSSFGASVVAVYKVNSVQ